MFVALKPLVERGGPADQVIARLRIKLAREPGAQLFLQPGAGHPGRRPPEQCAVPVHAAGRRARGPAPLGAAARSRAAARARARRRQQRPAGRAACRPRSSSTATARRAWASRTSQIDSTLNDAFGQRRCRRSTAAQPVPRGAWRSRRATGRAPTALNAIYVRTPSKGVRCRSSAARPLRDHHHRALGEPPGPVRRRRRSRSTCRPTCRLSQATRRRRSDGDARDRHAGDHARQLPGHGARVPAVARQPAVADPGRADRRLHRARHPLRELGAPDHDPLDAAVGRRRRAAGADGLRQATSASSR